MWAPWLQSAQLHGARFRPANSEIRSQLYQPRSRTLDNDRRTSPRLQVLKNGKILFIDQPCFVECIIRNISEDGALLSLIVSVPLPRVILLWEQQTGKLYECGVKWRKDHMVGVHFTDVRARSKKPGRAFSISAGQRPVYRGGYISWRLQFRSEFKLTSGSVREALCLDIPEKTCRRPLLTQSDARKQQASRLASAASSARSTAQLCKNLAPACQMAVGSRRLI